MQTLAASLREQVARELDIAAALGADAVRIGGARSPERAYTGELVDAMAGLDITVDIVNQNHAGAFSAVDCLSVVDALGNPHLSLAFSPDHCVLMHENARRRGSAAGIYDKRRTEHAIQRQLAGDQGALFGVVGAQKHGQAAHKPVDISR